MVEDDGHGRVVVGLDDSIGARVALRYAVQEARDRGAPLEVVTASCRPSGGALYPSGGALYRVPLVVERETVHAAALAGARAVVDEVLAGDAVEHPDTSPPRVAVRAEAGDAGPVLVGSAREPDVLVVGHPRAGRDRDGPARLRRVVVPAARSLSGDRGAPTGWADRAVTAPPGVTADHQRKSYSTAMAVDGLSFTSPSSRRRRCPTGSSATCPG